MVGIPPLFPWIGDRKISVGMDGLRLKAGLLPAKLQAVMVGELLERDVEVGNLQLVVQRPHGVLIERLAAVLPYSLIGEAASVGYAVRVEVKVFEPAHEPQIVQ